MPFTCYHTQSSKETYKIDIVILKKIVNKETKAQRRVLGLFTPKIGHLIIFKIVKSSLCAGRDIRMLELLVHINS